jgi:hypothetical protein
MNAIVLVRLVEFPPWKVSLPPKKDRYPRPPPLRRPIIGIPRRVGIPDARVRGRPAARP